MEQIIKKEINIVNEACQLLYNIANEITYDDLKENFINKYNLKKDTVAKKLDFLQEIYDYVKNNLSITQERFWYFFKKFQNENLFLAKIVLLPDENYRYITLEDIIKRNNELTESERFYLCIQKIRYAGCVYDEFDEGEKESITFKEFNLMLQNSELTDVEKWNVQQAILDYDSYLNELEDVLSEVIEFMNHFKEPITKLVDEFYNYWVNELKDKNIYEYLLEEKELNFDKSQLGVIIVPTIILCNTIGFVEDDQSNEPVYDIFYIGILFDEDFRPGTKKESSAFISQGLKLLSDKSKLEILMNVKDKKVYGAELAKQMKLSTPTISYHMSALLDAGFVVLEKENTRIYYTSNKEKILELLDGVKNLLI